MKYSKEAILVEIDMITTILEYYKEGKLHENTRAIRSRHTGTVYKFRGICGLCHHLGDNSIDGKSVARFTEYLEREGLDKNYPVVGQCEYDYNLHKWYIDKDTGSRPDHEARAALAQEYLEYLRTQLHPRED